VAAPAVAKLQQLPAATAAAVPLVPRGGRAALQVAFKAPADVNVRTNALVLRDTAGNGLEPASVFLIDRIKVSRRSDSVRAGLSGSIPDPLLPLPTKAPDLAFQTLYVEIRIPRDAPPGRYTGTLVVDAGRDRADLPVAVDVATVQLPAVRTLRTWFLVWDDRAEAMERAPIRSAYHALLRDEGVGDGTADSADLAVGVDVDPGTPGAAERVEAEARALLQERPDAIAYSYEFDEPEDDEARAAAVAWGKEIEKSAPDVSQLVTAPPWDDVPPGAVGTFAVHLRDAADVSARVKELGAELWIYNSCCERPGDPTLLLDDAASGNASVATGAWLAGGKGVLYWGVSVYRQDPWQVPSMDPTGVANGDGVLVYPGRPVGLDKPVPSLRLKLFNVGMDLVDLAALAEQRGAGAEARSILTSLTSRDPVDPTGTSWQEAERRLVALAGG
jgi:hypothetical protein